VLCFYLKHNPNLLEKIRRRVQPGAGLRCQSWRSASIERPLVVKCTTTEGSLVTIHGFPHAGRVTPKDEESWPFPFDIDTDAIYATYECPFWEDKLGIGQFAQALLFEDSDLVIMLAFYGDGSGEHGKRDGSTFVLAGYLANTIDWFQMERDWCKALCENPPIKYFKARECIARQGDFTGQFKGWHSTAVEAKRHRFAEVIRKHNSRIVELSSTIRWAEYDAVIGTDVMRKTYYHPFHFCFHGIASLVVEQASIRFHNHKEPIAFVFDTESKQLDFDIDFQYKYARETLPREVSTALGSLTFCSDLNFPMIQTADLLAWSVRSEKEGLPSPVLDVIRDASQIGGSLQWIWRADGLSEFVKRTESRYHAQFG